MSSLINPTKSTLISDDIIKFDLQINEIYFIIIGIKQKSLVVIVGISLGSF